MPLLTPAHVVPPVLFLRQRRIVSEAGMDRIIRRIGKPSIAIVVALLGISAIAVGSLPERIEPDLRQSTLRRLPPTDEMRRLPHVVPLAEESRRLPSVVHAAEQSRRLPHVVAPAGETRRLPPIVISSSGAPLPSVVAVAAREPSAHRLPPVARGPKPVFHLASRQVDEARVTRRLPPISDTPTGLGIQQSLLGCRRLPEVSGPGESCDVDAVTAPVYLRRWNESGPALISVAEQSRLTVENGYRLAEKGALYSARAEFIEALRGIAIGLDAHFGGTTHTDSLLQGIRALKEADDFVASRNSLETPLHVDAIITAHRSRIPGVYGHPQESAVLVMQKYYEFSQDRLAAASGGSPIAAEALYALGKVYMAFGKRPDGSAQVPGPKSMAYLSASLMANPTHAMAANELGVFYARLGKLSDARLVLQQSVAAQPLAENLGNLAVVYQRIGKPELAAQTIAQLQAMRGQNDASLAHVGNVRWVDPSSFTERPHVSRQQAVRNATRRPSNSPRRSLW